MLHYLKRSDIDIDIQCIIFRIIFFLELVTGNGENEEDNNSEACSAISNTGMIFKWCFLNI